MSGGHAFLQGMLGLSKYAGGGDELFCRSCHDSFLPSLVSIDDRRSSIAGSSSWWQKAGAAGSGSLFYFIFYLRNNNFSSQVLLSFVKSQFPFTPLFHLSFLISYVNCAPVFHPELSSQSFCPVNFLIWWPRILTWRRKTILDCASKITSKSVFLYP